ncbi:MAG: hypothetical protein R3298_11200 [Gammaproteobacteria bacterium]|nr:hypothetical protein [Gammaproteobacteria bacterium]
MMRPLPLITLALAALLLTACAATTKQASWTDPEYAGRKVASVFIIGTARSDLHRRLFEDELARELEQRGVRGIPSYRHFSLKEIEDREATELKIRELGAESVIVAKVVGSRTDSVVTPARSYVSGVPYYPTHLRDHWHDYFRNSYSVVSEPATVRQFQIYTVETNLYSPEDDLIWSMQSETIAGGQLEETIREFVDLLVEDLSANGLI